MEISKEKITELERKLKEYRNANIEKIDKDDSTIRDVKDINIDSSKSSLERILEFIGSGYNPYIFKVNGYIVKTEFTSGGPNAEKCVIDVFKSIYK